MKFAIENINYPPENIQKIWANIDPEGELNIDNLDTILNWLNDSMKKHDYICIQGEFGAAFYVVEYCFKKGFTPVYATSKRIYEESKSKDGSVTRKHIFKHVTFRKYRGWQ